MLPFLALTLRTRKRGEMYTSKGGFTFPGFTVNTLVLLIEKKKKWYTQSCVLSLVSAFHFWATCMKLAIARIPAFPSLSLVLSILSSSYAKLNLTRLMSNVVIGHFLATREAKKSQNAFKNLFRKLWIKVSCHWKSLPQVFGKDICSFVFCDGDRQLETPKDLSGTFPMVQIPCNQNL